MTVLRRRWADLPQPAREAIQAQVGTVTAARSAEVGLTSGVAASITTEGAAFFVKAAPAAAPVAPHLLRERAINQVLPAPIPAPRLLWTADIGGWITLLFEHAPGSPADLAPSSPDLAAVADAVAAVSIPCPLPNAPSVTAKAAGLLQAAEELLAESPAGLAHYEPLVKSLDPGELTGPTLLHADLHADNLLVNGGQAQITDWSMACTGAAWIDAALLVPRLIDAGHTPEQAEEFAARFPAWESAPPDAVTALASVRFLFSARMAEVGPPHLQEKRLRAASAGRAWVEYRLA